MKKITFALPMDGVNVRSLDALQEHFTAAILPHVHSGLLVKWLDALGREDLARAVDSLDPNLPTLELFGQLCHVLGLEADETVLLFLLDQSPSSASPPSVETVTPEQDDRSLHTRRSWLYARHPLLEDRAPRPLRTAYLQALLAGVSAQALEHPPMRDILTVLATELELEPAEPGELRGLSALSRDERRALFSQLEAMKLAWIFLIDLVALQALSTDDMALQDERLMMSAQELGIEQTMPLLFIRDFVEALNQKSWPAVFRTMSDLFFMLPDMHSSFPVFARAVGAERMELTLSVPCSCRHKSMPLSWNMRIGENVFPRQKIADAGDHIPDRSITGFFSAFVSAQEPFCYGDVISPTHGILAEILEADGSKVGHGQRVGILYGVPGNEPS